MRLDKEGCQKEKGQSLTELAMSMAVILLVLGGLVDLGRAFFTYMAIRDSVQEGALYGSINPTLTQEIKNHVRNSSDMVQNIITDDDINVLVLGSACTGNGIRVQATYPDFPLTMPFLGAVLGRQTIAIRAEVTDTILSPACD